jgi:hypothetical protein
MSTPSICPTHKLYSASKLKSGKSSWTEIGVAFPHKDGNGFAFKLTSVPAPGGEFVMRRDTRPAKTEA